MPQWVLWFALTMWAGATLLLSRSSWFRAPKPVDRLRPYTPADRVGGTTDGAWSAGSIVEVIGPLVVAAADRCSRLVGVHDHTAARLERSGLDMDVAGFRMRQALWSGAALFGSAALGAVTPVPGVVAATAVLASPLLAFLVVEHRLSQASEAWQQRTALELPVVIEQLGMLLSSGFSLGAAVTRMGQRGDGACATELARISARLRQGVPEIQALREWATRADLPAVDRLVAVLALNWEAGDLGTLISAEARTVRREAQRAQLEIIERRAQQVWIPVTVATLLPGVIFMAVPFVDAMQRITGG